MIFLHFCSGYWYSVFITFHLDIPNQNIFSLSLMLTAASHRLVNAVSIEIKSWVSQKISLKLTTYPHYLTQIKALTVG